ncbi:MAG TPA: tRNA uridine-5-carboxymethylaminomethyl(34) synthesis GTPase MnmE [Saprospiraceae bacterium]|nr:tRNA uridine-5-carboxymethylaminomethyl(34) synthesis GTPase MnmE [Saprospiraceae bacterium]
MYEPQNLNDTIVSLGTPFAMSAIGVVRLSGPAAIDIVNRCFEKADLRKQNSHTMQLGTLKDGSRELDQVMVSLFKAPNSYTGQDSVEISAHGSPFILEEIVRLFIKNGARHATEGEYTMRAYLNGKMDLAQAEAVADLIASESEATHRMAIHQLKGGFSRELEHLRSKLIEFTSLLELELDFSEEDVEFADRDKLSELISEIKIKTKSLIDSFKWGNAIKKGIHVAIIGKPNVGKSTLLNALLQEDRAIVSEIPGTTRDTIEEVLHIQGVLFRIVDTAGIRQHSTDKIENLGIQRAIENAEKAQIILHVHDLNESHIQNSHHEFSWLSPYENKLINVYNKYNVWRNNNDEQNIQFNAEYSSICIDAKDGFGLDQLKNLIFQKVLGKHNLHSGTVITNVRHLEILQEMLISTQEIENGIVNKISGELLTSDIRRSLYLIGLLTGKVEIDKDILGSIFGRFCIGK